MTEYRPIEAGPAKKSGGLAGCLVASLVGCGLIVAVAISVAIFIGWRLTREAAPAAPVAMRDGTETFYLKASLRGDDPGVAAVVEKLFDGIRRVEAEHSPALRNPMLDERQAGRWREWFPCELELARASRGSASESTVIAAEFPAKTSLVRATFRLLAYFLPQDGGAPFKRADIDGTPVILVTPVEGVDLRFALALVGGRVVGAREFSDLQAALGKPAVEVDSSEASDLAGAIRVDNEDGWGYTRPRAPESQDAIHLAVFSFDLQAGDTVQWRAALRGQRPVTDRPAAEKSLIDAFVSASLPDGVALHLDDERKWLDDRTLMVQGNVQGIEKLIGGWFESEPGPPPAAEPPPEPKDEPQA